MIMMIYNNFRWIVQFLFDFIQHLHKCLSICLNLLSLWFHIFLSYFCTLILFLNFYLHFTPLFISSLHLYLIFTPLFYSWTLTKRLEKKLDGNYTRMLWAILNKSWRQHPTRHQPYGHLPPITKIFKLVEPDMQDTAGEAGINS